MHLPARLPFVDFLRAVASNLIVLHHVAFYGPLSDTAYHAFPGTIDFLYTYGRYAVQVFFVLGGLFAARGCRDPAAAHPRALGAAIWARYRRAGLPYLAAIALAIAANAVARNFAALDQAAAPPTAGQLVAHALFLHNLLGLDNLSAGVWYVAVDFQLFLLVTSVWALTAPLARLIRVDRAILAAVVLLPLATASALAFNRNPALDNLAIYFLASYWLGMSVEWTLSRRLPWWVLALSLAVTGLALGIEWRPRLCVAMTIAVALYVTGRAGLLAKWPAAASIGYLGRISYSLFLVHFPVFLVIAALVTRLAPRSVPVAIAATFTTWLMSIGVAALFHRFVEARFHAAR